MKKLAILHKLEILDGGSAEQVKDVLHLPRNSLIATLVLLRDTLRAQSLAPLQLTVLH
jgi:hypothetical protein